MSLEIRTPFTKLGTVQLSGGKRPRYRKQIMKLGTIRYRDRFGERLINFDRPYLASLVDAFKQGAYDQVPIQLAGPDNGHNNDPTRFRGDLIDVELTADGIDGIFEPTPEGEQLIRTNPKLGVSCRIIEGLPHPDGRNFPRAIQHVLATVDPQLTGMRPWQQVELSQTGIEQILDFSAGQMEETMPTETDTDQQVTLTLPKEKAERLEKLLEDLETADTLAELMQADPDQDEPANSDEPDDQDDNDEGAGSDPGAVDLSRSEQFQALQSSHDIMQQRVLELTRQVRDNDLNRELEELARQGLAPAIIKKARPLLALPEGVVELSSPDGSRVDPAGVMRDLLHTVVELSQRGMAVVELDAETGYVVAEDNPDQARRNELLDELDKTFGR